MRRPPGPRPRSRLARTIVGVALVSVGVVTWNSEPFVSACLEAVAAQTYQPIELLVADNASADGTRRLLTARLPPERLVLCERNLGFSAAHNRLIVRSYGTYYLALNPDVVLEPGFVAALVAALERDGRAGAAAGKLLRVDPPDVLDSTGIVMLRSQRHLDRGADERDAGQLDAAGEVFGVTGAAGFYRRAMLDDIRVAGEYFDEDFFAYREDADLAWRAQWFGWRCLYEPAAVARHHRRVTPERRRALPADINRASVRNRFLLRIKNQTPGLLLRCLGPALWRDLLVVGGVVLTEPTSLGAFADLARLLPRALAKRRTIMRRRRLTDRHMARWFV